MSDSGAAPPLVPPPTPSRSGLSPLAWIAIVVGVIGVVGVTGCVVVGVWMFRTGQEVVREATGSDSLGDFVDGLNDDPTRVMAETLVRVNPELDLLSTDEDAGTITFRNNRTGEEATLNFEDIAGGRFSMTTDDGEFVLEASESANGAEGGLTFTGPDGAARFGRATDLEDVPEWVPLYPGATETTSAYQTVSDDALVGAVAGQTTDSAQVVVDHYAETLQEAGYAIGARSLSEAGAGAIGAIAGKLAAEERSLNVVAIEQDGDTQVMVNYSGRP